MTKINPFLLPEHERINRQKIRESPIEPSFDGSDIYIKKAIGYQIKIKKPSLDAQGAIDCFFFEEGMRQQVFYPYLLPGSVVFDVGAHHGAWTLPALALGARVFSFEPDPRWVKSLMDSVDVNPGFRERFVSIPYAVADANFKSLTFDELEDVQCTTIDYFVEKTYSIPEYIKIDCEGMEARVILGAMKTLKHFKPRILIEHHPMVAPKSGTWIVDTLQEIGYIYHPTRFKTDWVVWSFWDIRKTEPYHFKLETSDDGSKNL